MSDPRERLNDPEEAIRTAVEGLLLGTWVAQPGIILSFSPSAPCTAVVQLAIQGALLQPDGTTKFVNITNLVDVPVYFPSGGGFTLTFPVKAGDECLVVLADRCIDSWWQNGGVQPPAEFRFHDLSDGFAFVGFRSKPRALANISMTTTQLRADDGSAYVEVAPGGNVNIHGTLNVDGDIIAGKGNQNISLINHLHQDGGGTGDSGPPVDNT